MADKRAWVEDLDLVVDSVAADAGAAGSVAVCHRHYEWEVS